jgi:hypothetical protein
MGMDSEAHVMYGYNLGGPEHGWKIAGLGEYGVLSLPWYNEDDEDEGGSEDETDFHGAIDRQLLNMIGFTETYADGNDDYYTREREAEARLKVGIMACGSYDYPSYVLYAIGSHHDADWGAEAADLIIPDGADRHLAEALAYLRITPTQPGPSWVIGSFYG